MEKIYLNMVQCQCDTIFSIYCTPTQVNVGEWRGVLSIEENSNTLWEGDVTDFQSELQKILESHDENCQ